MWHVYILRSEIRERYYIGVTESVPKRFVEHNKGKSRATRPFRPWKIIHIEDFIDKREAYKREYYLKHPKGYLEKLRIIRKS